MNHHSAIRRFKEQWAETSEGQRISAMITGGGFAFGDIGKLPGASSVLNDIFIPYNQAKSIQFTQQALPKGMENPLTTGHVAFVGPVATELYLNALINANALASPDARLLVINASITTTRYRRGVNEAWIWMFNPKTNQERRVQLSLSKADEQGYAELAAQGRVEAVREMEDAKITMAALAVLMDDIKFAWLGEGETITDYTLNDDGTYDVADNPWIEGPTWVERRTMEASV
tara:strand:- start:2841 stop:3536 length:696 start_codon:yes stop_codon:yes gene_type:complete